MPLGPHPGVTRGPVYGYPTLDSPTQPAAFTEGKLFLGGLNCSTTKESLMGYCKKWSEEYIPLSTKQIFTLF